MRFQRDLTCLRPTKLALCLWSHWSVKSGMLFLEHIQSSRGLRIAGLTAQMGHEEDWLAHFGQTPVMRNLVRNAMTQSSKRWKT